jgi:hypothetical protein
VEVSGVEDPVGDDRHSNDGDDDHDRVPECHARLDGVCEVEGNLSPAIYRKFLELNKRN